MPTSISHGKPSRHEVSFSGGHFQDVFRAVTELRKALDAKEMSPAEARQRTRALRRWVKAQPLLRTVKDCLLGAIQAVELQVQYQQFYDTLSAPRR